jgi:dimethylamine monooxygenase subunit A
MSSKSLNAFATDLFPDEDFRFRVHIQQGSIRQFFAQTPQHQNIISERRHWLSSAADRYAAFTDPSDELLDEALQLAIEHDLLPLETVTTLREIGPTVEAGIALSKLWEPDFLLLKLSAANDPLLVGGCVCFPSAWDLTEKVGLPVSAIHSVVPELNDQIGRQIGTFLGRMRPNISWERLNWGLSRSPELNQHPHRCLPPLDETIQMDDVWFRIEHQSLVALPRCNGVLFSIRISMFPLRDVKKSAHLQPGLLRALLSMPESVARYKNVAIARNRIVQLLSDPTPDRTSAAHQTQPI